jgi:hypothetical protein
VHGFTSAFAPGFDTLGLSPVAFAGNIPGRGSLLLSSVSASALIGTIPGRGILTLAGLGLDLPQPAFDKVPVYSGTVVTVSGSDASAFESASATLRANNGGTYVVPPGTYTLGRQVAGLNGLLLDGVPSIDIRNCTNKVVIDVRGCTFLTTPGLKFGAFDPDHGGVPIDITTFAAGAYPHPPISYACQIGPVIWITGNTEVEVWGSGPSGTLFDGNINNINIGGLWHAAGDGGRALQHYGIWYHENHKFSFFNGATGKHFCTDAFSYGWVGMNSTLPTKPHYHENLVCLENGRLGASWVGGNHAQYVWCEFRRNSMIALTNGIQSVPSSGMDFENETSFDAQDGFSLWNGTFTRCIFSDNYGCGLISASGQSRQSMTFNYCTFDAGHGQTSVVPSARLWTFNHCLLVGAFNGILTQADAIANGGTGATSEAIVFNDSTFDVHGSASLAGLTHEWADSGAFSGVNTFAVPPQINLAGYAPKFNRCTFNIDNWLLDPDHNTTTTATYTDCTFNGPQSGAPIWGIFNGVNNINYAVPYPGWGTIVQNLSNVVNNGSIYVNGVLH